MVPAGRGVPEEMLSPASRPAEVQHRENQSCAEPAGPHLPPLSRLDGAGTLRDIAWERWDRCPAMGTG